MLPEMGDVYSRSTKPLEQQGFVEELALTGNSISSISGLLTYVDQSLIYHQTVLQTG
jgi:hypothetical protein